MIFSDGTPQYPINQDLETNLQKKMRLAIPSDAFVNLRGRNNRPYHWSDYKPIKEQILVRDMSQLPKGITRFSQFREKYPKAKAYIAAWLPGYSKNGQTALIHFLIGPNAHGSVGTYVLTKQNNRWKVKQRHIESYL